MFETVLLSPPPMTFTPTIGRWEKRCAAVSLLFSGAVPILYRVNRALRLAADCDAVFSVPLLPVFPLVRFCSANDAAGSGRVSGRVPLPYEGGGPDVGDVSQLCGQHQHLHQGDGSAVISNLLLMKDL